MVTSMTTRLSSINLRSGDDDDKSSSDKRLTLASVASPRIWERSERPAPVIGRHTMCGRGTTCGGHKGRGPAEGCAVAWVRTSKVFLRGLIESRPSLSGRRPGLGG